MLLFWNKSNKKDHISLDFMVMITWKLCRDPLLFIKSAATFSELANPNMSTVQHREVLQQTSIINMIYHSVHVQIHDRFSMPDQSLSLETSVSRLTCDSYTMWSVEFNKYTLINVCVCVHIYMFRWVCVCVPQPNRLVSALAWSLRLKESCIYIGLHATCSSGSQSCTHFWVYGGAERMWFWFGTTPYVSSF